MRHPLRVVVGLPLLVAAVVLAQAALLELETELVASPKDAKFVPAKTAGFGKVRFQTPVRLDEAMLT